MSRKTPPAVAKGQVWEVYSVRDIVTERFTFPFYQVNDAAAVRSFYTTLMKQPNPQDYELYLLGTWSEDTGHFNLRKDPVFITDLAVKNSQGEDHAE